MTAKELVARMEVREETISWWENDKEAIGPSSEKLLRLVVADELQEAAPAIDYDQHAIVNMRLQPIRLPELTPLLCLELVRFKSREHGKRQRWDTALPDAA